MNLKNIKKLFRSKPITMESLDYITKDFGLTVSSTTSYIAIKKLGFHNNVATLDFSLQTLQVEKSLLSSQEIEELSKKYEVKELETRRKDYWLIRVYNTGDLKFLFRLIVK